MHEVEQMFSVKETPWHGLGNVIQDAPTIQDGIKLAGLDWEVKTIPLFTNTGISEATPGYDKLYKMCKEAKACVRSTDNSVLGIVGPKYVPLQNAEAFDFFQPFLDANEAKLHTAGSLRFGQRVWILAELNREPCEIAKDDLVRKFILLSNSHDGKVAVRVGFTPIRVVCANTLAMAHSDDASKLIRIRHRSKVVANLEAVRDTMNAANAEFEATAEQYRLLVNKNINSADLLKYVKLVLKIEENEKISTRSKNIIDEIVGMFEGGFGNATAAVKGTWWAAYNAVTQYLNYSKGRNSENRINNLWFGQDGNTNKDALNKALEAVDKK